VTSLIRVGLTLTAALIAVGIVFKPSQSLGDGDVTVALCDAPGVGVDNARVRGLVFTVDRPFESVQVRLDLSQAGHYDFTAEIRRSTGFVSPPVSSQHQSYDFSAGHLYIQFEFGPIPVVGRETFTFRLTNVATPDDINIFYEGAANVDTCPDFYDTNENNVADPSVRGNEMFVRVLGSSIYPDVWGDTLCDGLVGVEDALAEVRQLAGISQPAAIVCTAVGSPVLIDGTPGQFADWNCSGTAEASDAVAILAAIGRIESTPVGGCRAVGAAVSIDVGA
jgi:hypothetical protein